MRKQISKLWFLGPPVSLALVAAALYVKQPWARDLVNTKIPWVKDGIGKYAPPFEVVFVGGPEPGAAPAAVPVPAPAPQPAAPDAAPAPRVFDLQQVYADATLWPKSVALKKPSDFPAVRNGKVIGSLKVPVGAEVRVLKVAGGKVGLEYQGGGAWLDPKDTDFAERARAAWH